MLEIPTQSRKTLQVRTSVKIARRRRTKKCTHSNSLYSLQTCNALDTTVKGNAVSAVLKFGAEAIKVHQTVHALPIVCVANNLPYAHETFTFFMVSQDWPTFASATSGTSPSTGELSVISVMRNLSVLSTSSSRTITMIES